MNLTGGLGNQMFQYASSLALAKKLQTELVVNTYVFENYDVHPLRLTELNCTAQFSNQCPDHENIIKHKLTKKLLSTFSFMNRYYFESTLTFEPAFLTQKDNSIITGFFQSEKYFTNIRKQLLKEFNIENKLDSTALSNLATIKKSNSVSMHIRRGDYILNPNANKTHGLCDNTYYKNALQRLKEIDAIDRNTTLFIFSDDIDWCRENLNFDYPCEYVTGANEYPEFDMYLMSQCNHNIVANSTFSWWGAWLNDHNDKVVIAPTVWFQSSKLDASDIIPDSWIRV